MSPKTEIMIRIENVWCLRVQGSETEWHSNFEIHRMIFVEVMRI